MLNAYEELNPLNRPQLSPRAGFRSGLAPPTRPGRVTVFPELLPGKRLFNQFLACDDIEIDFLLVEQHGFSQILPYFGLHFDPQLPAPTLGSSKQNRLGIAPVRRRIVLWQQNSAYLATKRAWKGTDASILVLQATRKKPTSPCQAFGPSKSSTLVRPTSCGGECYWHIFQRTGSSRCSKNQSCARTLRCRQFPPTRLYLPLPWPSAHVSPWQLIRIQDRMSLTCVSANRPIHSPREEELLAHPCLPGVGDLGRRRRHPPPGSHSRMALRLRESGRGWGAWLLEPLTELDHIFHTL